MTKAKGTLGISPVVSRILYFGMVGVAILLFAFTDSDLGVAFFGMALFFDPFDQSVPLNKRPYWQQGLLIVHALSVLGVVFWDIFT